MFLVVQKGARVPIFSQFLVTPLRLFCTTKSNTNGDAKENKSQKSKTERDLEQVKRFLRKSPELKKKWRKKLEVEESKLYIKSRIENSQKPEKKEEISKRKLFKQQPLDPQILEYIKKYKLHFVYPGEAPPKVEPDNKFVAGVFKTENSRLRVCKSEDRYPEYESKHVEIALTGRSNAGKSSFIRALLPRLKLSQAPSISEAPGKTRAIHFIQLNKLTVVDLPGYGFNVLKDSDTEKMKDFTETYLSSRKQLKRVLILLDARHGLKSSDMEFIHFLESNKRKYQIVFTKVDLVEAEDLARRHEIVKNYLEEKKYKFWLERILMLSSLSKAGISAVRKELASLAYEGPQEMPQQPLRIASAPNRKIFGLNQSRPSQNFILNKRRGRTPIKGITSEKRGSRN